MPALSFYRYPVTRNEKQVFLVYPNPSNGSVFIQLPLEHDNAVVRIYNSHGQMITEQYPAKNQHEVQLIMQDKGLYLVEVETEGKNERIKLLVL